MARGRGAAAAGSRRIPQRRAGFAVRSRSSSSPPPTKETADDALCAESRRRASRHCANECRSLCLSWQAQTSLCSHLQEPQRRAQSPRQLESWGAEGLSYRVAGEDYWVSRGGFFQVNRFLVDELVRLVTAGRQGAIAWDLYAGVGLFSRALAKTFQHVVAVEAAANDLSKSFKGPGKRAVEATTVEFLRNAVVQRERPELIVMDPPQSGRRSGGLCSVGADFSAGDRLRLLRSRDSGPRSEVAGRGRLQAGRAAHGRYVSTDVSSGDGGDFAQVIAATLW